MVAIFKYYFPRRRRLPPPPSRHDLHPLVHLVQEGRAAQRLRATGRRAQDEAAQQLLPRRQGGAAVVRREARVQEGQCGVKNVRCQ